MKLGKRCISKDPVSTPREVQAAKWAKVPSWMRGRRARTFQRADGFHAELDWHVDRGRRMLTLPMPGLSHPGASEGLPRGHEDCDYYDAICALLTAGWDDGHSPRDLCDQALESLELLWEDVAAERRELDR
jgi:hypothetical protein